MSVPIASSQWKIVDGKGHPRTTAQSAVGPNGELRQRELLMASEGGFYNETLSVSRISGRRRIKFMQF
jgi:hypothetical protein